MKEPAEKNERDADSRRSCATLRLPGRAAYFVAATDFAETLSRGQGFDSEEQKHIRLALEEIFEFLQHAVLRGREDASVTLSFEFQADGMLIRMLIKGLPFDTGALPVYSPADADAEPDEDGLSLFLAKKVMDSLVFSNRGREGLELEMFKHRVSSHVGRQLPHPAGEPQSGVKPSAVAGPYVIRPLNPSEAIEVSRCAYLTYGHTYEDFIYYPGRIVELNRSGEMRSLVAASESGEVMGHCALKFVPGRLDRAELGVLFVKPPYRKHGLGAALWKAAVEMGRSMKLESVFARSVTGHRASQTMAAQNGFQDCALSLSLFPHAVDIKEMGGLQQGKMSGMLQVLPLTPPRLRSINPPERHAEIVVELYRRAGIPAETAKPRATTTDAQPIFKATRVPVLNVAIVEVERVGGDTGVAKRWTSGALRRLCREKLDVIYLYLHLEESGAAQLAEHCASEGFIFSGIAPGAFAAGDALVLQYLNLTGDPFAQMTVWTETAGLLRDYIFEEWEKQEIGYSSQFGEKLRKASKKSEKP